MTQCYKLKVLTESTWGFGAITLKLWNVRDTGLDKPAAKSCVEVERSENYVKPKSNYHQ